MCVKHSRPSIYIKTIFLQCVTNRRQQSGGGDDFEGFAKRLGDRQLILSFRTRSTSWERCVGVGPRYEICRCDILATTRHAIIRTLYLRPHRKVLERSMPYSEPSAHHPRHYLATGKPLLAGGGYRQLSRRSSVVWGQLDWPNSLPRSRLVRKNGSVNLPSLYFFSLYCFFIGMLTLLEIGRRLGIRRRSKESEGERAVWVRSRVRCSPYLDW